MMSAPWSVAHRMPAATSPAVPVAVHPPAWSHSLRSTRTAIRSASGATPATPRLLFVSAAAIPATWVPCPLSSWADPLQRPGSPPVPRQLVWATTLSARSSWPRSMPESITAIVMPSPVAAPQASGAPILVRPHWRPWV